MSPLDRRRFLSSSFTAAATTMALGGLAQAQGRATDRASNGRKLRILILGGTGFIGPYAVRHALERGHEVTLFNRGRTNVDLFPDLEKLVGDRDGDLDALRGRDWDVVLDNTGYVPRVVRDSAELLKDSCGRYLFTSTRMIFADFNAPNKKEDAPRATIEDPTTEDVNQFYGPLKVLCENVVNEVFGERATIVRPCAVAGPNDRSDRFTYWPVRLHRGGEVLAPGDLTDPVQYIDVRDLAEFMVHLLEGDTPGVFNTAGPAGDLSMAELLYGCNAVTSSDVSFTWIDSREFLEAQELRPRRELPLWIPPSVRGTPTRWVNSDKAMSAGLTYRPLAVTALDTLEWWLGEVEGTREMRRGLTPQREAEVLAAWHARG